MQGKSHTFDNVESQLEYINQRESFSAHGTKCVRVLYYVEAKARRSTQES